MGQLSIGIQIVAHNAAAHLRGCLKSLQGCTDRSLRIMITDDASDDATAEIIRDAAAVDRRIVVITNPSRLGLAECRRVMVEKSGADLIVPLAPEDVLLPGRLERQRDILTGVPFLTATYGKTLGWNGGGGYARYCAGRTFSNFRFFRTPPFCDGALMCRREALVGTGNFAEPFPGAETQLPGITHTFMWQRLALVGPLHFDDAFVRLRHLPPFDFHPVPHLVPESNWHKIRSFMLEFAKKRYAALLQSLLDGRSESWRDVPVPLLLQLLGILAVAARSGGQDDDGLIRRAAGIDPDDYGPAVDGIERLLRLGRWAEAGEAAAALERRGGEDRYLRVVGGRLRTAAENGAGTAGELEDAAARTVLQEAFLGRADEVARLMAPVRDCCLMRG